jgi:Domain of unknown function (DUF4158)
MPGIRDTAYPLVKSTPSAKELEEVYTPNLVELVWAEKRTRERTPRVGLLVLLKTFQRLGYFVMLSDVPPPILEHVAQCAGYEAVHEDLIRYGESSVRRRHMLLVRDYVGVKAWGEEALQAMQSASRDRRAHVWKISPTSLILLWSNWFGSGSNFRLSQCSTGRRSTLARWSIESINRWSATGSIRRRRGN